MAPEHVREEHQAGDYQEVLTDQSDAAKGTLRFLHERSGDRVLVNGVDPGAGDCNGFVVASGDASALGGLLESIPLKAARIERVVAFSYWGNSSGFLLQSQRRVFGYTEALLAVNIGQRPEYYQLELSDISFRRLPGGLKGKWPRMTHGIENFHGKEFKVATFNCSLFSSIGPFDSYGNPRWIAGSDMRLIHEVSRILNFTYKVVLPAEETLKSGRGNKAYIEDIMGQLKTGGADIAACGLWMTSDRINSDVHMTTALSAITIEVLVPRQQPVQISYSVVFVFQYTVWCLILALVLITSVCLWLIAMYYKKKRKPTGKYFRSFCQSFFRISSILVLNNIPRSEINQGAVRHIISWWVFASLVITTCFSSCLISNLTKPQFLGKPESLQQLIEEDYIWATLYEPHMNILFSDDPTNAEWMKRMVIVRSDKEFNDLRSKKKVALFAFKYNAGLISDDHFSDGIFSQFEPINNGINKFYLAIALQPGSPLSSPMSKIIWKLLKGGLIRKIMKDNFYNAFNPITYREEKRGHNFKHEPKALTLRNFLFVFYLLHIGLTISSLTFVFEIFSEQCSKRYHKEFIL